MSVFVQRHTLKIAVQETFSSCRLSWGGKQQSGNFIMAVSSKVTRVRKCSEVKTRNIVEEKSLKMCHRSTGRSGVGNGAA